MQRNESELGSFSVIVERPSTPGDRLHGELTIVYRAAGFADHLEELESAIKSHPQYIDVPNLQEARRTPLFHAASKGNEAGVVALIKAGSKAIDTPDANLWTPMHAAAHYGRLAVIETLCRLGSKAIDTPNKHGWTPLHAAAEAGFTDIVELLFRLGCQSIDTPAHNGWTPMHSAAKNGRVSVVQALLQGGCRSIDTHNNKRRSPLYLAAKYGHIEVIDALVQYGSREIDSSDPPKRPLHTAAKRGHTSVIETLFNKGGRNIDVPNNGSTAMHYAAEKGQVDVIRMLYRLGSKATDRPDRQGCTPLFLAAKNGHSVIIELLVRRGSTEIDRPDNTNTSPLHAAVQGGHMTVTETLVRLGSKLLDRVDGNGRTPLAIAIDEKNADNINLLLRLGADFSLSFSVSGAYNARTFLYLRDFNLPVMRFVRSYDAKSRTLSYKGGNLTNEAAATLPLNSWRSCATVDLRDNPNLSEIPVSLGQLNPDFTTKILLTPTVAWSTFEADISAGTTRQIIEYATVKARGDLVQINERKLMAVGSSAVGKTTVIRRLKDENYTQPLSTDGVDMGELRLRSDSGDETLRIVVWDFAGQPLYRQTHLLFLRNPGLCLLMFKLTDDPSMSVEQLRFWCDSLRSLNTGGRSQSRVLLVGTHLDRCADRLIAQETINLVWERLQAFLPFSDPPVMVSCADGPENKRTIHTLQRAIFTASMSMNIRAPACIEMVRRWLMPVAATEIPLLTSAAAHEIIVSKAEENRHNGLATDVKLREMCLQGLQTLGSAMVLEDRGRITHVVANPQWVALLLSTVVTTRHTWVTRGRVTLSTLSSKIWGANNRFPPETHHILVAILEQLKIMFPLDNRQGAPYHSSQVFFIPCSLPEQRPHPRFSPVPRVSHQALTVDQLGQLRRLFKLTELGRSIPIGVLPQVIVQMMTLPNTKLLEVWQQGGVFRIKHASSVLVSISKTASDVIEVLVQTSEPNLASEWIRELSSMIEHQLSDVYHLGFEVRVPCILADDSCFLLLDDLRTAVFQQCLQLTCRSQVHPSRVDVLAPDLVFADFGYQSFVHRWSSVKLIDHLGRGAFGRVMLGQLDSSASSDDANQDSSASISVSPFSAASSSSSPSSPPHPPSSPPHPSSSSFSYVASSSSSSPTVSLSSPPLSPALFSLASLPSPIPDLSSGSPSSISASASSASPMLLQPLVCEQVAIKLLESKPDDKKSSQLKKFREFQHEAYLMSLLKHPNVVRFIGVCLPSNRPRAEHESSAALLMEVVNGGTLYDSLTDSVGILKVVELAADIKDVIDEFNVKSSMFKANPQRNPCPAPIKVLEELCEGALGRIAHMFDTRICAQTKPDPMARVSQLRDLKDRLAAQLALYYKGPMTRDLHLSTDDLMLELKNLAPSTNEYFVPIGWAMRLKLATDVARGLMYLHSLRPKMVHRDFKSPNLLLTCRLDAIDSNIIDWWKPLVKLADFGLSIRMQGSNELKVGGETDGMSTITPTWAAPEVLSKNSYSAEADVYAMGILLWELLTRQHPFAQVSMPAQAEYIVAGGRPLISQELLNSDDELTREYIDLLQRCWAEEPASRPQIDAVYAKLRDLCRRVAPVVFASLPEPASNTGESNKAGHSSTHKSGKPPSLVPQDVVQRVTHVEPLPVESVDRTNEALGVRCLEAVGGESFWVGLNDGSVAALQFDDAENVSRSTYRWTRCCAHDRHKKSVSALCYNSAQLFTVWSGSHDGRICVWSADVESLDGARSRCYMKGKFVLVDSNLKQLTKHKGKVLHLVLRNGWLFFYPDEHVGPPCFELDLGRPDLVCALQPDIELSTETIRVSLRSMVAVTAGSGEADDSQLLDWQRTIAYIGQTTATGRGLSLLATSPQRRVNDFITALEATDEATWCLSLSDLVEWLLLETHHGLHTRLRLEPGRQLTFDMTHGNFADPRLRSICGLAWVAPSALWVGAANTIAHIDLAQTTDSHQHHHHHQQQQQLHHPGISSQYGSPDRPSSSDSIIIATTCLRCFRMHEGSCAEFFSYQPSSPVLTPASPSSSRRQLDQASVCVECHQQISMFRRRRQCASCQAVFCKICLPSSQQVCKDCCTSPRPSRFWVSIDSPMREQSPTMTTATLRWPAPGSGRHADVIRLLALVETTGSPSGYEVWTYARDEDILVWQTPLTRFDEDSDGSSTSELAQADALCPVSQVRLEKGMPLLNCLKQVGNQVWAGTGEGTIVGWDIATRNPLAELPLPHKLRHCGHPTGLMRPTTAITTPLGKKRHVGMALSSGFELTLRRFTLELAADTQLPVFDIDD